MSCTREEIVALAKSWLGRKEGDGSHKKIVDIYNSHKPRARGYRLKYTDSWCSGTISALAIACNATDIIPTEVGCQKHIVLFQKLGIWVEDDGFTPLPGDILFYDWDDSGKGDNLGHADHVGIVEKVSGDTITVIEGNYQNSVKRRILKVGGRYIRGYGVPHYDSERKMCKVEIRVLKKGAKGKPVKAMQLLLMGNGFSCGEKGADGSFGADTEKALRAYQKAMGLSVDGSCGAKTWGSLLGGE